MKLNKKAFTIVELVIVIAIIAILAAVLIPTFANMINKANVAKDTQLIRNLNTALASSRASNNNENHKTLYDALQAADAFGYDIGKINASATNAEILWDQENDVFCYLEGTNIVYLPELVESLERLSLTTRPYHLWKIFNDRDLNNNEISNNNGFSIYWNGDERTETVVVNGIGFDAGTAKVDKISYINTNNEARKIVIRTNSLSSALTVNGYFDPSDNTNGDVINHYGEAGALNIISVASASYHEFGQVSFAEITKGRIVLEEKSNVKKIHLHTSEVNNEKYFDEIIVAKAASVAMPEFSRDPVEIPTGGRLVAALQSGTETTDEKLYVWLTAVGIYEQVTISDSNTEAGHNFASNLNDQEKQEAARQIANIITATIGGKNYTLSATTNDNGETWNYSLTSEAAQDITESVTVSINGTNATVSVSGTAQSTTIENGLTEQQVNMLRENAVTAKSLDIRDDDNDGIKETLYGLGDYWNDTVVTIPASVTKISWGEESPLTRKSYPENSDITYPSIFICYNSKYEPIEAACETLIIEGNIVDFGAYEDIGFSTSIKNIIMNSVENIPGSLFLSLDTLESIEMNSVKTIEESAFFGCSKIESITLPASLTSIGNNAFNGMTGLKSVRFESQTLASTSLPNGLFMNSTNLEKIYFANGESAIWFINHCQTTNCQAYITPQLNNTLKLCVPSLEDNNTAIWGTGYNITSNEPTDVPDNYVIDVEYKAHGFGKTTVNTFKFVIEE
ncbi:MAG: leucine-rich repeat domain-containing protein [Clostridia bacterium]|nr:leucine-rich repeat domain-containing protein [Clostridia bacterium]